MFYCVLKSTNHKLAIISRDLLPPNHKRSIISHDQLSTNRYQKGYSRSVVNAEKLVDVSFDEARFTDSQVSNNQDFKQMLFFGISWLG